MPCRIKPIQTGYTISFQTRGLSEEEVSDIWQRLSPKKLKEYTEMTGHNILVWRDGLVAEVRCGRGDNITVWCGKEIENGKTN